MFDDGVVVLTGVVTLVGAVMFIAGWVVLIAQHPQPHPGIENGSLAITQRKFMTQG